MGKVIFCPACNERIEDKRRIEKHKLLIVEGRDEEEFFGAMLENLEIQDIQVMGIGGKTQIRPNLKALLTDPNFDQLVSLGIVRDADSNAKDAFRSIQDALKNADLPCPNKPLIQTKTPLKVSVMILPPNGAKGALEDTCLESVKDDPATSCVEAYFDCLDEKKLAGLKKI